MKHWLTAFLLLVAIHSVRGEEIPQQTAGINQPFAAEITRLEHKDSEPLDGIWFWDDKVVIKVKENSKPGYFVFDPARESLQKLEVPGLDSILLVDQHEGRPIALGMAGKAVALMEKQGGTWTPIPTPPAISDPSALEFVPCSEGIALLEKSFLYHWRDGKWLGFRLPPSPPRMDPSHRLEYDGYHFLQGSQFFNTWNRGEFGGMVGVFDTAHPNRGWRDITGSVTPATQAYDGIWITGLCMDQNGRFWLCEGMHHRMSNYAGLYRYDGSQWTTLLHYRGAMSDENPPSTTHLGSLVTAPDANVYTCDHQSGFALWENDKPVPVLKFNFDALGWMEKKPGENVASMNYCYVRGFAIDRAGNIFVATINYGILYFMKENGEYHLRQYAQPPVM